jgi:cob(I)alamin adenosyltransferase
MVNTKTIVTSDLGCDYPNLSDPDPRTPYLPKFHELPGYLPRSIYRDRQLAEIGFSLALAIATRDEADILILDEISLAINFGLLTVGDVVGLIKGKSSDTELVLTGRDMPQEILAYADLVTEMREIKHPYAQGIPARRGIEY